MKQHKFTRYVFAAATIYDALLGILFLIAPVTMYNWLGGLLPNHLAYVQFPALLLLVFAWMFYNIARDPEKNKSLITYGIMMKLSFTVVVLVHWIAGNISDMWKPMAIADLVFAVLFYFAYKGVEVKLLQKAV